MENVKITPSHKEFIEKSKKDHEEEQKAVNAEKEKKRII
jgi:hypothetical protein